MSLRKWILVAAALIPMAAETAQAHLRDYLETYGYNTLQKGRKEVELRTDLINPDEGDDYWTHESEFEYGITDRWTVGVYAVFREGEGFTAAKLENRIRLAEPGEFPVDPAFYFEIKDANGRKDNDEVESKLILSKDIGLFNITWNGILAFEKEYETNGDEEWETELGMVTGVAYRAGGPVTPGLELAIAENDTRLIPGVYIDLGPSVRLNLGVSLGLEKTADNTQLKSLLEIEF